jgi:2-polyprenyl-3-methyl-5-hydroxy-6-metoxy-1,4-benzoquinol methylase
MSGTNLLKKECIKLDKVKQMRKHNEEYQNNKERKYAYDFDYILREYILKTLSPFFSKGKALELGCFEGEMTSLIAKYFDNLTVVEAVKDLIPIAKSKVPEQVKFIHGTIETVELESVYDSIFIVHTLEHLDDPVEALRAISQWLTPSGRLFVVVPNAQAPSRQIAVKMGLIDHNSAVTAGEQEHGHRCTYSLDTLERDAKKANLSIESRGGVFFKPFANFQFDLLLNNKIIDRQYIDGCYALGMQYPELTASIYLVCNRNLD